MGWVLFGAAALLLAGALRLFSRPLPWEAPPPPAVVRMDGALMGGAALLTLALVGAGLVLLAALGQ